MIKRLSMLLTILGFVLLWFGINESHQILIIAGLGLVFTGVIGMYYGFNTMKGTGLLRGNNLLLMFGGIIALAIVAGILLGF